MKGDRDFLRQLNVWYVIDRLFTICTPAFCALAILAAIVTVVYKG